MPLSCTDYFCPPGGSCVKRPLEAAALAPWVKITFPPMTGTGIAGTQIITNIDPAGKPDLTVGNNSNLPNNHAAIKSFQYGTSDGAGAEVEIYDEEGGEFNLFVNKMVKVLSDANTYGCSIEWGWALGNCDGSMSVGPHSARHFFLIISVNIHYAAGGVLFKLELLDVMQPLFETRTREIISNVSLKRAIEILFREKTNPKIPSVLFKRMKSPIGGGVPCNNLVNINGNVDIQSQNVDPKSLEDFKFKGALEDGKTNWPCENQNPLACVREWLKDKMTDRDKGTIVFWNSTSPIPELIILEDPMPKCWSDLKSEQCARSLGTYIVNGGNASPVLSFDPQIKFTFATLARSGAVVDTQSVQGARTEPVNKCPETNADQRTGAGQAHGGDETFVQMNDAFNIIYGPGNIKLAIRGVSAMDKANKPYENIEAELRIQGDPSLDNPLLLKGKTVSLVVINPFHLRNAGGNTIISGSFNECPEWLIGPPCNQVLSNKNWIIGGVSHEIKEGSFTTTLKLRLPAPGQN